MEKQLTVTSLLAWELYSRSEVILNSTSKFYTMMVVSWEKHRQCFANICSTPPHTQTNIHQQETIKLNMFLLLPGFTLSRVSVPHFKGTLSLECIALVSGLFLSRCATLLSCLVASKQQMLQTMEALSTHGEHGLVWIHNVTAACRHTGLPCLTTS